MQELALANKQLVFKIEEKQKRADELFIPGKELTLSKLIDIES
jgi:hypothetical protein